MNTYAQEPSRIAWLGAIGSFTINGLVTDSVASGSTLYKLGLQKGDTLKQVNELVITEGPAYYKYVSKIRSGDVVSIKYKQGKKLKEKKGKAQMLPYDTSSKFDIVYGWADVGDCRLRTIVRKPKSGNNLPAVLLIPGYNCGSIENYKSGSYGKLIRTWLEAGFVVVTIEKSGLGDSYNCIPCSEADLAMDIKVFDAGYQYMERLSYVDKKNLFIWGHSMGGVIAPLIAERHQPKGVIAFATVFRPWSEFLLEMHRVQWPLDGKSYAETESRTRLIQKVYYEFFVLKKSPAELYQNPEYKDIVASELEYADGKVDMWGRHWRFWQQIDSLDLASAWGNVNCKVLSVFGGADFVACSELEHELIVRAVNSKHPGNAKHINIPDVDHLLIQNPDWLSAHKHFMDAAYKKDHFHQGFADTTAKWMKSVLKE